MRRVGSITLVLLFSLLAAAPAAQAQKRIALLIGNQDYTREIGKLANPHNDIALLEKALKGLQFEVTSVLDAGLAVLHQAVNAHVRRVRVAGPDAIAFFYYAGHGAADAGTNYLIPIDIKSAEEGELWDGSLRLTEITRKLRTEAGNATHFVVFDACRNNLKLVKAGSRALVQSRGFVPVAQEAGMLIAYATAEDELASDVGAGAGPYASVLAEEIVKPGVEAVTMFRNVQRRVRVAIQQEPYLGFNALGDIYLAGLAPPDPSKVKLPPAPTHYLVTATAGEDCVVKSWHLSLLVQDSNIFYNGKQVGSVDADGSFKISYPNTRPGVPPGVTMILVGTLKKGSGGGRYVSGLCSGTFIIE